MNQPVMQLEAVGSTVRLAYEGMSYPAVHLVLLVGSTLASHYWMNILAMSGDIRLRYFLTEEDYLSMQTGIHVKPNVVPSFLVVSDGFFVDWFPAPLPATHSIQDPSELVASVRERLRDYE